MEDTSCLLEKKDSDEAVDTQAVDVSDVVKALLTSVEDEKNVEVVSRENEIEAGKFDPSSEHIDAGQMESNEATVLSTEPESSADIELENDSDSLTAELDQEIAEGQTSEENCIVLKQQTNRNRSLTLVKASQQQKKIRARKKVVSSQERNQQTTRQAFAMTLNKSRTLIKAQHLKKI